MSSLIPNFEYDIFISYRHNDNRSGWVTEFVKNLQEELASVIKDPVSVYFDTNPNNGLLETHNVDKSLEGKLKCLIFIPIISQTYCDVKSFAWQHEFCAFNKQAKEDRFGRDIKLSNGNVASRILPIKIHDLDIEDKALIEKEIGGVLRAIEFIFKSSGVNRPLRESEDHPQDNLNKSFYRDQINKVANAIKEIIQGLHTVGKIDDPVTVKAGSLTKMGQPKSRKIWWTALIIVIALLSVFAYWFVPQLKKQATSQVISTKKKSIAVLAFKDLSPTKNQTWLSEGLSEEILNTLANLPELVVPGKASSFYFANKPVELQEIAKRLQVEYVLDGSVMLIDDILKVSVSLVRAEDGNQVWNDQVSTKLDDAFKVITDIATNVAQQLEVVLDESKREKLKVIGTKNMKAFEYFLRGKKVFYDFHLTDQTNGELWKANEWFDKTLEQDSALYIAYLFRSDAFNHYVRYGMPGPVEGNLSFEEAEKHFLSDLSYAESHCKKPYERLVAAFEKKIFSKDWKGLPALAESLLQEDLTGAFYPVASLAAPWTYMIGKTEMAISSVEKEHQSDPLNTYTYYGLIAIYGANKNYDKIEVLCDEIRKNYGNETIFELPSINARLLLGQKFQQAIDGQKNNPVLQAYSKVLAGEPLDEATIDKLKNAPLGMGIFVFWQMGDVKRSNEIIANIDKKNPYYIFELISYFGIFHIPFELEAAPNFVRQMKEAGIEAEKVFKPMPRFSKN